MASADSSSAASQSTHWIDGSPVTPVQGFTLSHDARDFLTAYYATFHQRQLTDDDILAHVNAAHDQAMKAHPYRCIAEYRFTYPRVAYHPHYTRLIQHNPSVASLRVLDVGSCMGSDLRQMLLHGVAPRNALGLELVQHFIDVGLDTLFQDRALLARAFTAHNILSPHPHTHPALKAFLDEAPLSLVYCGSVYHLLLEEDTHTLTRHVYHLLPPGGEFFGRTVGSAHPLEPISRASWNGQLRFLHSTATFTAMCLQYGFIDVEFVQTGSDVGQCEGPQGFQGGEHKSAFYSFYARKAAES